jgi:hypothetical protein
MGDSDTGEVAASSATEAGSRDDARSAFLAGIEGDQSPTEPALDAVAGSDETPSDDLDAALAAGDDDEIQLDAPDDEDADLDDEEDSKDPETKKRLDAVRRTDKRLREQRDAQFADRERAIESTIKQWEPRIEAAERFEKLKPQARYQPEAVLAELGVSEADYADIARRFWALSDEGKKDPKAKAAAERLAKDREVRDELAEIKKQLAAEQEAKRTQAQQLEREKAVADYIGKVTKLASDKTPLAKKYITADPDAARVEIEVIAGTLAQRNGGQMPTPREVMIAFEKQERLRLKRYGLDPVKAVAPPVAANTNTKTDAKKPVNGNNAPVKKNPRDEFITLDKH